MPSPVEEAKLGKAEAAGRCLSGKSVQKMSGVGSHHHSAQAVEHCVAAAVCLRGEVKTGNVLLVAELPDSGVERQNELIAGVVEEDLALLVSERVNVEAETRRPVVVEQVVEQITVVPLLFPAQTGVDSEVPVHLVAVVDPTNLVP